jgi:hypothetical protein
MLAAGQPRLRPGEVSLSVRQRLLLNLLEALGGHTGKMDFQKLLFLYCQDPVSGQPYEFVPYKFGAFSFTSYADRRKLVERGLLADDDSWHLTQKGKEVAVALQDDTELKAFAQRWGSLCGDALVAETYRRYPYYATRSEIAKQVLAGDKTALRRIGAARPPQKHTTLYTIGYEGQSLERYLNTLIRAGTTLLCDVRRNPISRKYGFSKTTLSRACEGVGIRYEHIPELGIASSQRRELDSQESYDALFAAYEHSYLPGQTASVRKVQCWIADGECVALTCYEHLPNQCHRHCVSDALTALSGGVVVAQHL